MENPSTIQNTTGFTGNSNHPKRFNAPSLVSKSAVPSDAIVVGSCEIIDAKINVEIPLPIPCSVINSPIHIKITDPAVIDTTDSTQSPVVGTNSVAIFADTTDWYKINIYAMDCTTASGTVSIRVHWLIFRLPLSPSFESSSSRGIAFVSNCITIEPVIYGDKPTNIILNDASPPPEIKFKKFEKSDFSIKLETASLNVEASPIGTGICASKR